MTRGFAKCFILAIVMFASTAVASAQFSERPYRIIVPFGAGGNGDITARILSEQLKAILGQNVVVENLPGPGGMAAARATLSAPRDGQTVIWLHSGTATGVTLVKAQAFDPLRDFAAIGGVSSFDHIIATSKQSPMVTLNDLLSAARKRPGALNAGTVHVGGSAHLTSEYLKVKAGITYQGIIFRSGPELIVAALREDVQFVVDYYSSLKGALLDQKLHAIATTGLQRTPFLPGVPTAHESGLAGFESIAWNALYVARGTPQPAIDRLSEALRQVLARDDVQKRLLNLGIVPDYLDPAAQDLRMRTDIETWRKVAQTAGIAPN